MVTNELSDAVRKLELTFNKKIENMIRASRGSFFKSDSDTVPQNIEASDSFKFVSPEANERSNFFLWARKKFFGK